MDDFKDLRSEIMDLQKANRSLRKDLDDFEKQTEAREEVKPAPRRQAEAFNRQFRIGWTGTRLRRFGGDPPGGSAGVTETAASVVVFGFFGRLDGGRAKSKRPRVHGLHVWQQKDASGPALRKMYQRPRRASARCRQSALRRGRSGRVGSMNLRSSRAPNTLVIKSMTEGRAANDEIRCEAGVTSGFIR